MNIGLVVRGEKERGLGVQIRAIFDNLHPTKTLGIDMGTLSPYPQDFSHFPNVATTPWTGDGQCVDHNLLHEFCRDLDIVFSIETFYDIHLPDIAREHNVASILYANAEFHRHSLQPDLPAPTMFWLPTRWRADHIPVAHHVPMPITTIPHSRPRHHAATFLHIAGHKAARDRNGTRAVLQSLRRTQVPVIIRTQSPLQLPGTHNAIIQRHNFPTTAELFAGADCLILPRRYGGLCLPISEALARGMPVIASDRIPESDWLPADTLVPAPISGVVRTPAGNIPAHNPDPHAIAQTVNRLHQDKELFAKLSWAALDEAESRSWKKLRPLWYEKLNEAVDLAR